MKAGIVGLGLWVPDQVRHNSDWPAEFVEAFQRDREARKNQDFSIIQSNQEARKYNDLYLRHSASYSDDPFKAAVRRRVAPPDQLAVDGDSIAVSRALEDARVDPRSVDLVLSSALVPDRIVPSNGPEIALRTGCVNAPGFAVDSVCSSSIPQLDLASALVESGRAKYVVCAQSHLLGRANDLRHAASPLFGDASTAFVVGPVAEGLGVVKVVRGGDGSLAGAITFAFGGKPEAKWWKDANGPVQHGSEDYAAAHRIGNNLLGYPIDTIRELCSQVQLPVREIAALCMIQPVAWFQAAVAEGLGLPLERVPSTHVEYAHIGATGVVANLVEARRRGLLREGAPVVLYAHGAGLTRFAALVRWTEKAL